jgi:hypothetical protein
MRVIFEESGDFIAVEDRPGEILCRIRSDRTDIGDAEDLREWSFRHGDAEGVLNYMRRLHAADTRRSMGLSK